jgi:hydroxyacylglutathione hydrolase
MELFSDLYVYPWLSQKENNANTVFIDGDLPVLIDPGHLRLFNHVIEGMARDGKTIEKVKLVLCTHGHPDHMEAIERFDDAILKTISRDEYAFLMNGGGEMYLATGCRMPKRAFAFFLRAGTLKLGDKTFRIIPTPGHSPGSICIYWEEKRALISGDTVFYMGVGRTDLPGGNTTVLAESIRELSRLNIDYLIPGHGEIVKGAKIIEKNFSTILSEFFR